MKILLIEDSLPDIALTRLTLKKLNNIDLEVITDGITALQYLKKEGDYKDKDSPDIILLDLNLPGRNGTEILTELKWDKKLREIPVVILTSSRAERDIRDSYNGYANAYLVKPIELKEFEEIIRKFYEFWIGTVTLP